MDLTLIVGRKFPEDIAKNLTFTQVNGKVLIKAKRDMNCNDSAEVARMVIKLKGTLGPKGFLIPAKPRVAL